VSQRLERTGGFGGRYYFLLRRLHSLSGIIPVGVFVIFHLFTNAQLALGTFQHEVDWIHSMPALLFAEIAIWASIGFHAVLGLVYTFYGSQPNATRVGYFDNWRYVLQRWTGIIALIFIFLHVATLRWRWDIFGWFTPFFVTGPEGEPLAAATTAMALQSSWLVVLLYVVGVLAVIYHWSNGLWTAAITWGLTISEAAQNRWKGVCGVMGVALTIFFVMAIVGALTYEVSPEEIEAREAMIRQTEEGVIPAPGSAHEPVADSEQGGSH